MTVHEMPWPIPVMGATKAPPCRASASAWPRRLDKVGRTACRQGQPRARGAPSVPVPSPGRAHPRPPHVHTSGVGEWGCTWATPPAHGNHGMLPASPVRAQELKSEDALLGTPWPHQCLLSGSRVAAGSRQPRKAGGSTVDRGAAAERTRRPVGGQGCVGGSDNRRRWRQRQRQRPRRLPSEGRCRRLAARRRCRYGRQRRPRRQPRAVAKQLGRHGGRRLVRTAGSHDGDGACSPRWRWEEHPRWWRGGEPLTATRKPPAAAVVAVAVTMVAPGGAELEVVTAATVPAALMGNGGLARGGCGAGCGCRARLP